jgi:hypothetical protein
MPGLLRELLIGLWFRQGEEPSPSGASDDWNGSKQASGARVNRIVDYLFDGAFLHYFAANQHHDAISEIGHHC